MFENIIGQKETKTALAKGVSTGSLPPSLLFYGPPFSGKLSTALELTRVLGCRRQGEWSCTCPECEKSRLLAGSNLLILGARNYFTEIAAAADVLKRTGKDSARYLFIRGIRKQLKGFNPILWEDDAAKIKPLQNTIFDLEEKANLFHPGFPLPGDKEMDKLFEDIFKGCKKLAESNKSENIPINHIRKTVYWAHHSSPGTRKVVIINNADKMQDASRNSLLKILEEPPEEAYFILLTSRKGAIIQTLLSRLRPFFFKGRTPEEDRQIMTKIFKEESGEYSTLREFFLAWKDVNPGTLKKLAARFLKLVLDGEHLTTDIHSEMKDLFNTKAPKEAFTSFVEELYMLFETLVLKQGARINGQYLNCRIIEKWTGIVREALFRQEHLNINPQNLMETIYYRLKQAL